MSLTVASEPTKLKPQGATIPLTIYNTYFEVEPNVEESNLTPTQEEIADLLMLHELMADEPNPPTRIANVLREIINGCTTDGIISSGPNCPTLDEYLGKLSLLVFQTQQGIRGPLPVRKGADIYGDVTIKICIPIEKLKELLGITITTPVVETPETEKAVEDLQGELISLRELIDKLQAEKKTPSYSSGTQLGGGKIEELQEQIRTKLKSLVAKMLDLSKKIPKDTPLYREFDKLLVSLEEFITDEVAKEGIKVDDIPIADVRKSWKGSATEVVASASASAAPVITSTTPAATAAASPMTPSAAAKAATPAAASNSAVTAAATTAAASNTSNASAPAIKFAETAISAIGAATAVATAQKKNNTP